MVKILENEKKKSGRQNNPSAQHPTPVMDTSASLGKCSAVRDFAMHPYVHGQSFS
jgi:hypothetical protein